jgi:RHS repeat-associated protein
MNSNKTSYAYEARNRVTARTDALNRPTSIAFSGDTITPTFGGGNRPTKVVDSTAGTITRVPDLLDRLISETTPQGSISYSYDNASRRQTMQVAGQPQVVYGWDNANRLTGITQGSSAVGINYDNANRRTSLTLPNGVTVGYSVDNDSRITGLTYSAGSTQLGNLTYGYDADGRVTSKNGTLAAISLPTAVSGNTFNADNGMTAFGGATLSYDANGNLTNDGTNTYTWDARNHLAAISGAVTASFTYDAFGRRASKSIAGTSTQFLYDILNPVQEIQGGAPSANLLTGLKIDEYFARTDSSNNVSTFLRDQLGSTIGLVGSGQNIATSYTYQPFGATTTSGAPNGNSYQFTGRENDGSGLYFYRARYYSSTFQRFIAQDPIGFRGGDTNLYAYSENNSPSLADPFGTCPQNCAPSGDAPSPAEYQTIAEAFPGLFDLYLAQEFAAGEPLDAQAYGGSQAYANYVFGVYMAAAGYSLGFTLNAANAYASGNSSYPPSTPMDPYYPATPASNIANITQGFIDEQNGNLCTTGE